MPLRGQRHRLVLYTYILDRWFRATLVTGFVLLALVAGLVWLPSRLPQYPIPLIDTWILWITGGLGAFAICLAILLFTIRNLAYVQPCENYLRLVTPFVQMNISYRRFIQASTAEMGRLFQVENLKGRKQAFLLPISKHTAIVLELRGWPMPRRILGMFLSPYFFPDKTSRLALLIPDWMRFSTELESYRAAWIDSMHQPGSTPQSALLASLTGKK